MMTPPDIGFMGTGRDTKGDWACPRCSNLNWNNRDKCNRCPQLKGEKPPPTPAELKAAKEAAAKAKKKVSAEKQKSKQRAEVRAFSVHFRHLLVVLFFWGGG